MADYPNFRLARIEALRDALFECLRPHVDQQLDGEGLVAVIRELRGVLPTGTKRNALFESVRHLTGRPLSQEELWDTAWRLAGNTGRLQKGLPAPPWTRQAEDEWVPLQIVQGARDRNARGAYGYMFHFRALAGTPCAMLIRSFWSNKLIHYVSRRIGYTAPFHKYPFKTGAQLVLLKLLGKIEPNRSRTEPGFHDIACPDPLVKWNRENVIRQRLHIIPCPRGWKHACHVCAVGYLECPGAVHRHTYERGPCSSCDNDEAYFDPELSRTKCIECVKKTRPTIAAGRRPRNQ